jgi:hypothetical protein
VCVFLVTCGIKVNVGNSVRDKGVSTLEIRITPKMADISVPGYHAF